jgi:quercetin dioxygenase-like cupin family protein
MDDNDIPLASGKVQYKTLLREESCSILQTTVQAGGETQWHHHTNVSDRFLVIRGVLTVELNIDGQVQSTKVREFYSVDPGTVHHVKNETNEDVVYLTVQAGGVPDIVLAGLSR